MISVKHASKLLKRKSFSMMNSRRTLKSIEGKIGQNNLAVSLQVSPSTIRRWKKKNKIPKAYSNKIAAIKELSKNYKRTRKLKLRNQRAAKLIKYQSLTYHPEVKSYHIFAEAFTPDDIPKILKEWETLKIKGKFIEYVWLTAVVIDRNDEIDLISTYSMEFEEMQQRWKAELDQLLYQDYSVKQIISIFVKGIVQK